jgi:hypothetical protein
MMLYPSIPGAIAMISSKSALPCWECTGWLVLIHRLFPFAYSHRLILAQKDLRVIMLEEYTAFANDPDYVCMHMS